jgi:hypothetical protein
VSCAPEFANPIPAATLLTQGDLTKAGDAAVKGEVRAQRRACGDEMTHLVHHRLDLLAKSVDMGCDEVCDHGRGKACRSLGEFLDASSFEGVAPPSQFARLTQVRCGWNPRQGDMCAEKAGNQAGSKLFRFLVRGTVRYSVYGPGLLIKSEPWHSAHRRNVELGLPDGDCQIFRVWSLFTHQAWTLVKRSPKRMANWALAIVHSRGGMIHAFSAQCKHQKQQLDNLDYSSGLTCMGPCLRGPPLPAAPQS